MGHDHDDHKIRDGLLSGYLRYARLRLAARYVVGRKILDIGCDRGYSLAYLNKDIEYVGIDSCQEAVHAAIAKYPQHKFIAMVADNDAIDELPTDFDDILLIAVLEHMEDSTVFLRKLKKLLKTGGRVIITSPSARSHGLLVFLAKIGLARNDKHEHEGNYLGHKDIMKLINKDDYSLVTHKLFQGGMNQLWVLEKN